MNKRIDFTKLGGAFFYQDTFEFMQDSYYASLNELGKFVGEKYVISGCVDVAGVVSDGYIVVNGERMKFIGGASTGIIIVEETIGQEGFDDGLLKDFFYTKVAKFGNSGGFPYTDLKRLPFDAASVSECVTSLARMVKNIIQFEDEVILEGCEVTNVTTGPDEMDVSAGLALFAGKLVSSPAYSGAYPAYLKDDGGWVTSVPGAGLYITFDPYTSQYYKDVLKRAITATGEIKMFETLTDRFNAGVGRWEMKGFSLMSAMQNRVPLGLWYDGVPEANVSDAVHQVEGNQGGEKKHTLVANEQGTLSARAMVDDISGGGATVIAKLELGSIEVPRNGASNQGGWGSTIQAPLGNAANEHENRQPFTVIVYAKRTA